MISIPEFNKEFCARHDFAYTDSEFLNTSYPSIRFRNIPEAWVCRIDFCLQRIQKPLAIKSISQVFGLLVLDVGDVSKADKKLLNSLEDELKRLDVDLHELLREGITKH